MPLLKKTFIGGSVHQGVISDGVVPVLLFMLGASSFYTFSFVGTLSPQDIAIAALAPLFFPWVAYKEIKIFRWLIAGMFTWLAVQIGTDFFRDIPYTNMAKGAARIGLFTLSFIFLWKAIDGKIWRVGAVLCGLALDRLFSHILFPTELGLSDPWKWSYGPALSLFLIGGLCLFKIRSPLLWATMLVGIGITNAFMNFRSLAGMNLAVAAFILFNQFILKVPFWARTCIAIGGAILILFTYSIGAKTGILGEEAKKKYEAQTGLDGTFLSVVTGGRSEYRASLKAIADSPIVGYGTWAQRPEYAVYMLDDDQSPDSNYRYRTLIELGIIPSHSMLFGAWVDGGILAGLFWLCLWIYVFNLLLSNNIRVSPMGPLAAFLAVALLWDILFSPLGTGARLMSALGLVVVITHGLKTVALRRMPKQLPLNFGQPAKNSAL